jgi:hypothetical protein
MSDNLAYMQRLALCACNVVGDSCYLLQLNLELRLNVTIGDLRPLIRVCREGRCIGSELDHAVSQNNPDIRRCDIRKDRL